MHIVTKNLYKRFGTLEACRNVDLEIQTGQLIGLLGPSGGGKTTLLRLLAGLERPDAGNIYFDGKRVNDLPPQQRNIGFVFQNYALFRHMTVYENIAFGLSIRGKKKRAAQKRVAELVELTGLTGLERRYPHQLSGGQRQRVAFARALAPEPRLLLLDEPFSALDAKVRQELRAWLKQMIDRVGLTTVFVTHDQEEALQLADKIFIINQGKVEQAGTPLEVYQLPRTPFVASFVGESYPLQNPSALKGFEWVADDSLALVRPEFVEIVKAGEMANSHVANRGVVKNVTYRGNRWQIEATVAGQTVGGSRPLELSLLQPGDRVNVIVHRLLLLAPGHPRQLENRLQREDMARLVQRSATASD